MQRNGCKTRPKPPSKIVAGAVYICIYPHKRRHTPPSLAMLNHLLYAKNMGKKSKHASTHITASDRATLCSRFLDLVASGMSARKACQLDDMPSYVTVWNWLKTDDDFRNKYQVAIELRAQGLDDQIDDTINEMRNGEIDAQQARVIVDTYKWRAAKLYPRLYGDNQKIDVEHKVTSFVDELKKVAAKVEAKRLQADVIEGEVVKE